MHVQATDDDRRIFARLMPVAEHARYLSADRSAARLMRELRLGMGSIGHRSTHDALAFQGLGAQEISPATGTYALSGWGYDTASGNFRRLSADVPVRLEPREYAKPGSVITYRLDTGERMHIPKRAIVER